MNEAAFASLVVAATSLLRTISMLVPDNIPPRSCEGIWHRFLAEVSFFHQQYLQAQERDLQERSPDR